MSTSEPKAPSVTKDPRFRAGRRLVQTGRSSEGAIDMFATLVEESRCQYGESSIEAAACYYEYGNALFRAYNRLTDESHETNGVEGCAAAETAQPTKKNAQAEAVANISTLKAAEEGDKIDGKPKATQRDDTKKKADSLDTSNVKDDRNHEQKEFNNEKKGEADEVNDDDAQLALEMMENSWAIVDEYIRSPTATTTTTKQYQEWAHEQCPRILLGIGDVLSSMNRHPDAVDAYLRALPYREQMKIEHDEKKAKPSVEFLKRRRQLTEVLVLIAEELLACPENGEDVVTTESNIVLVTADERVDFARRYYDRAKDELQETVFYMGKVASSGQDLGTEKEDVCFLATMLMGVGITLAEHEEAPIDNADNKNVKKRKTK